MGGDIGFEKSPIGDLGDRPQGNRRLRIIDRLAGYGIGSNGAIVDCQRLSEWKRVPRVRRCPAEFAPYIQREPPRRRITTGSRIVVKPVRKGATIVVDDAGAEMKAVAKRRTADGPR